MGSEASKVFQNLVSIEGKRMFVQDSLISLPNAVSHSSVHVRVGAFYTCNHKGYDKS